MSFIFPALQPPGLYDQRDSVIFSLIVTFPPLLLPQAPSIHCFFHLIHLSVFPSLPSPRVLLFLLRQDKSNPEGQSSWDSFKNMTPELSIVPGEQKERMELHNKNWDSSSANTPDSSEGDFQTEV